jgi:ATP adenylyltransferase
VSDECVICLKHRGEGPLTGQFIARIDGFRVYHAKTDDEGLSPLGWVFIESERHVAYIWDLTDDEAASLGRLRTRLAGALRNELNAEVIITLVIGMGVAHFHEHLLPRLRDAPSELPWHQSDEALPKAGPDEVAALADRLRRSLAASAN